MSCQYQPLSPEHVQKKLLPDQLEEITAAQRQSPESTFETHTGITTALAHLSFDTKDVPCRDDGGSRSGSRSWGESRELMEHSIIGNPWEPGYKARFPWRGIGALLLVVGCKSKPALSKVNAQGGGSISNVTHGCHKVLRGLDDDHRRSSVVSSKLLHDTSALFAPQHSLTKASRV